MKPLSYGYLRITDDLDHEQIIELDRGLSELAKAEGLCYATTFYESEPEGHRAFHELTRELTRAQAHHVVVASLHNLSPHPILRRKLIRLILEAGAQLWAVTDT